MTGLTTAPAGPLSGGLLTVAWNDANAGNLPAAGSWSDRVQVVNTGTGQTLVDTTVVHDGSAGSLAAGADQAMQYAFHLPDGDPGVGSLLVTVTVDSNNAVAEYNLAGTAETNNSTNTSVTSTLALYPDLQVANLVVTPTAAQSGNQITVSWNDANDGAGDVTSSFTDRVKVDNPATGQMLTMAYLPYSTDSLGALGAGTTSATRQVTLRLPDGLAGVGSLTVTVTTDAYNNVFEYGAQGHQDAESNNSASTGVTSTLAAYPDLQVANLIVTPTAAQSGNQITVTWNNVNDGTADVTSSFTDRVEVDNLTTGQVLTMTYVPYSTSSLGVLGAGATSATRQVSLRLPDGPAGVGSLAVHVTTDVYDNVFEYGAQGHQDAESNNSASTNATSTLGSYPDLQVTGLTTAPAGPLSGGLLTVAWNDANAGNLPAAGSWSDRVRVVNTGTGQTLVDTTVVHDGSAGSLAAGADQAMQYAFRLPDGDPGVGSLLVTVTVDSNNAVAEYNLAGTAETNNSTNTSVTSTLALYPDLQVANLVVTPTAAQSGNQITVSWNDANHGTADVTSSFTDRVKVDNPATGQMLTVAYLSYSTSSLGALGAGTTSATRQVTLPPARRPRGRRQPDRHRDHGCLQQRLRVRRPGPPGRREQQQCEHRRYEHLGRLSRPGSAPTSPSPRTPACKRDLRCWSSGTT